MPPTQQDQAQFQSFSLLNPMKSLSPFALALMIAVTGQVLYHFAQKSVAANAHPVVSLLIFYCGAGVLTLPLLFWFPLTQPLAKEIGHINWAVLLVAASIVLIELGFLLAYRAGGSLSNSFVLTAAVVTVSLAVIGVLFFKEALSVQKLIGAALCLLGIYLISRS
jgi:drug/metabolite transporter (DMT)-like permease